MGVELVRGQNHPLPRTRLEILISAEVPVLVAAALGDEGGRVRDGQGIAHPGAPVLAGVEVPNATAAGHRLSADLGALSEAVHRVTVLLALPGPAARFGATAAPRVTVTDADGTEIVGFTLAGLDAESAVVALELYRRQGGWKVRAVGQGYAEGLTALLADLGLPGAREAAEAIHEAARPGAAQAAAPAKTRPSDGGPVDYTHPGRQASPRLQPQPQPQPQPIAGDAAGWSMEERLYNQVWGMFEDLARSTAALRSAADFAAARLDRELDAALADPRARIGGAGEAARKAAQAKHDELMGRAQAAHDRDLAQLTAEAKVVEPALPAAYARWDSPVWQGHRMPTEVPHAVRLGDLHLPEAASLRIPMLVRLPLERGLWVDSGATPADLTDTAERRRLALDVAVALAARLLAVHPVGEFSVEVVDPAGSGAGPIGALTRTGALTGPPARGTAGVAQALEALTRRVDLVRMAIGGGATEALPDGFDTARRLVMVNDFPQGFDDRALTRLRFLADEGPAAGVHLLLVADRADAGEYGPSLDPLWRSLTRLTPSPDDHFADPWVGHAWIFEPSLPPRGGAVLQQVLSEVFAARIKGE
ncbi:stress response protein SCP2 [Streptomyces sp. BK022]|uniref:TerD family protein n=1 Tax=Streptomyces sp. BK022 TaxID=2512123 RepID=UPI001029C114|nr:TerD family protein [Streptomyces sp. BK022]RZU38070.1 stress response protein SCP2 [Streptomyces sp. BK022]